MIQKDIMNNNRNLEIDIIKGLTISLMVLGHTGFKFHHFIYLFHMAIFFIVAAYCYNVAYSNSMGVRGGGREAGYEAYEYPMVSICDRKWYSAFIE